MKTINVDEFMAFRPCYSKERILKIAGEKAAWSALDILNLDTIPVRDRLWAVVREELIPAPILHEFACRCAERALSHIANPDPRSTNAISVKRAWLRGDATDDELLVARTAAGAVVDTSAWPIDNKVAHANNAAWASAWCYAQTSAWASAGMGAGFFMVPELIAVLKELLKEE